MSPVVTHEHDTSSFRKLILQLDPSKNLFRIWIDIGAVVLYTFILNELRIAVSLHGLPSEDLFPIIFVELDDLFCRFQRASVLVRTGKHQRDKAASTCAADVVEVVGKSRVRVFVNPLHLIPFH